MFLDTQHQRALAQFRSHLEQRCWAQGCCTACSSEFYSRRVDLPTCGRFECEGGYRFIESKPSRARFVTIADTLQQFKGYFAQQPGFKNASSVPVVGHARHTIFTGTAGQVFDRQIFDGAPIENDGPLAIAQPVLRMQEHSVDGFLDAFVNISVEQLNATPDDHLRNMESFLDFLSVSGLYVPDLRIRVFEDRPDWKRGVFDSAVIAFYLDGLEIGVLNYFTSIPQERRPALSMSDCSFGLERLTWALNRTLHMIDVVASPLEVFRGADHALIDAYRSAVLVIAAGGLPLANSEVGSKLRKLTNTALSPTAPVRLDLVEDFAYWWDQVGLVNARPIDLVKRAFVNEHARLANEEIGIKSPRQRRGKRHPDTHADVVHRALGVGELGMRPLATSRMTGKPLIFLGGGGNASQSKRLDEILASEVRSATAKTCLYLPIAMDKSRHRSAGQWFKSVFEPVFENIRCCSDLTDVDPEETWGVIYLGGGNSGHLLERLTEGGGVELLRKQVAGGRIIYGGSAGAVVLGSSLQTVGEAEQTKSGYEPLNLLPGGAAVSPHFGNHGRNDERASSVAIATGRPVIAIPETGGVVITEGDEALNAGFDDVRLFQSDGSRSTLGRYVPLAQSDRRMTLEHSPDTQS